MKCPRCNTDLFVSQTHSIEVDYCPQCKGVWLDRGELDKIIEHSNTPNTSFFGSSNHHSGFYNKHHDKHYDEHHDHGHKPHRKKSFFSELFDF